MPHPGWGCPGDPAAGGRDVRRAGMPEESEEGLEVWPGPGTVELCPCGVPWCPVSAVRRTAGTAAAEGRRCVVVPDRHGPRLDPQARPVRFVAPWPENLEDAVKRLADLRAFGVPRFHGPAWSEVDAAVLAGSHWGREGGVTWKRLGTADMDERLTFSCIASHEMRLRHTAANQQPGAGGRVRGGLHPQGTGWPPLLDLRPQR